MFIIDIGLWLNLRSLDILDMLKANTITFRRGAKIHFYITIKWATHAGKSHL